MTVRFATDDEIKNWNTHILNNPDGGNILQGKYFAELKQLTGWTPRYIVAGDVAMTVIEKPIFGLGKVWYIAKGPGVNIKEQLKKLLGPLREFAHEQGCFTVKIEPELPMSSELEELGLTKTRPIQYHFATVIWDIAPPLETILKNMPQKGRYAIKRAERDGVTAKAVKATDQNCRAMYELFKETSVGAGFGIRPFSYYKAFWQGYEQAGVGQLFFAYFNGEIVAGAYVLRFGKKGTYKDGASIRARTAYGASHLLQWQAVQWLKKRGVTSYDLCGTPPKSQIENKAHPMHGVGLFKRSFNPEITEYAGAYELPVRPLQAMLWTRFIEKIVRRLYYKFRHQSYY